ncbi:MAG: hypothetical protein Tsb002_14620 [Wenzhouxiangellaceae bacterium]
MSTSIDHQLRKSFRRNFPEYAQALDKAKSQTELYNLHDQFIRECEENLRRELRNAGMDSGSESDSKACIPLKQEVYEALVNARGNDIKTQLQVIIDGMQDLKGMAKDDNGLVAAQIFLSGALGIGEKATAAVGKDLAVGAAEAAATYAGVEVATVAIVVALAVLVIVSIIIPLIYFIEKPANCLVLLINELDKPLIYKGDYNVHGKPMVKTTPIPEAFTIPEKNLTYPVAGFFATEKRSSALVGTQYGFTVEYDGIPLSYGVECPLTGIYVDNNCYCAIDSSAKEVAEKTTDENKQSSSDSSGKIKISIRCNSGAGSVAFYVARAYFA